jgi:energy-coupling factor transporter transmembrane protein EcfT
MSRLGWETVNTTTAAFVLLSLCTLLFHTPVAAKSAPLLTLLFIAIFVLLTLAVSGLGHATLLVIQKWATYVFGALNLLVGGFLCATIDWSAVFNATPAPLSAMLIGIGTMAAGTGIGWANAGADMSRYQHRSVTAVRLGGVCRVWRGHSTGAADHPRRPAVGGQQRPGGGDRPDRRDPRHAAHLDGRAVPDHRVWRAVAVE